MIVKTNLCPRDYDTKEVIRVYNPKQRDLYLMNGIMPVDIYTSINEDNKKILVYIFLKEDTREAYELWCKYELSEDTFTD